MVVERPFGLVPRSNYIDHDQMDNNKNNKIFIYYLYCLRSAITIYKIVTVGRFKI